MCGICGVHRFGDEPIDPNMVSLLILNNQNRGLDAAGIAIQQADGSIQVYKNDVTPCEFVASPAFKKFLQENLVADTVTVLGHTRKATKGTPRVNNNNHPMYDGETAVIHNGQIHNDDWLLKDMKLERRAETDSDVFRAILDKQGFTRAAVNSMSKLTGSAAIAAISTKHPGKLLLGRSGNPIELATTANHLLFSSEKTPLYKALRPFKERWGLVMREMSPLDYYMAGMSDNTAWLLSDKPKDGANNWEGNWLEWHQELRIASHFVPKIYTVHADYHGARLKFYEDRPVDVVQCPNPDCGLFLNVPQAGLKELKRLKCKACKSPLAA